MSFSDYFLALFTMFINFVFTNIFLIPDLTLFLILLCKGSLQYYATNLSKGKDSFSAIKPSRFGLYFTDLIAAELYLTASLISTS